MTDRELMQMALDALEYHVDQTQRINRTAVAMNALRAALAEKEPEPVAWGFQNTGITGSNRWMYLKESIPAEDQYRGVLWTPLYTAPPQREFIGLTDEEAEQITDAHWDDPDMFIEAIENVLRRKNT